MPPNAGIAHQAMMVGPGMQKSLEVARFDLALISLYFNKAEARDKFCRAIQYASKFVSNGEPGVAQSVERSSSLARKAFRLFKFVNDFYALLSPPVERASLHLILLEKTKNAFQGLYLFLDQIVWAGKTGIFQNKERTDMISKVSLYSWFVSCISNTIIEFAEFWRLFHSLKVIKAKHIENEEKHREEMRQINKNYSERRLTFIKSSMDIVVGLGLLRLAPEKVTPRVTGAFGFVSSLISCYRLLPKPGMTKLPASKLDHKVGTYDSPQ